VAEHVMVSTISFIQAKLQHSIFASRTAVVKGIDMALIQELWCYEGRSMGLYVPGYTLFSGGLKR
jgi:hypothetical protein